MTCTLASWNVNSIRARLDRVLSWLDTHRPDVLCVQESKVTDDLFPHSDFADIGYWAQTHGQKSYNGVALLSRHEITDVVRGFDDGVHDEQARFIGGSVCGLRVFSAYVPNGSSVGCDKYEYKLAWLARLRSFLTSHENLSHDLLVCGDWNVAPDARDVHNPQVWEGGILCTPAEREALQKIVDVGLTDTFRMHNQEEGHFSWWDYRMLGFPKNKGLRIDHLYASASLAARCTSSWIDREERKGKGASDHAPVLSTFSV